MKKVILISLSLMCCLAGFAQDRVFCRTYQTNVLPFGAFDFEYWNTLRSGRNYFYNGIDQRIELELGLGKKVQTAFYLNLNTEVQSVDSINITSSTSVGFSNEWKWKLSDPVANHIGSALYGEFGFNGRELELEGKIILDKQIDKNLFAVNLVGEYEIEYESDGGDVEAESENKFELDFAYMRSIGTHAGLGLEVRNNNIVDDGEWEHSPWFAGPTFHYHGDRWFINLNVQPQLFNGHKTEGTIENLELYEHEKVEARLIFAYSF